MIRNNTTLNLIEDFAAALNEAKLSDPEATCVDLAEAVMRRLQDRHGGRRMYVQAKSKESSIAALRRAYEAHEPVRRICKSARISTRTFYQIVRGEWE